MEEIKMYFSPERVYSCPSLPLGSSVQFSIFNAGETTLGDVDASEGHNLTIIHCYKATSVLIKSQISVLYSYYILNSPRSGQTGNYLLVPTLVAGCQAARSFLYKPNCQEAAGARHSCQGPLS